MPRFLRRLDSSLLTALLVLTIWGGVNFFSVSAPLSLKEHSNASTIFVGFLIRNILIPTSIFFLATQLSWRNWKKLATPLFALALLATLLAFIPALRLPNQPTARWLDLGLISFQPTEFLKLTTLLWFAFLVPQLARIFKEPFQRGLIILIVLGAISTIIFLQPALSNLIIFWIMMAVALMITKLSWRELAPLSLLIIFILLLSPLWGYRAQRLIAHFQGSPGQAREIGYQLSQTQLAVGSGGLVGRGIGNSRVKLLGIPLILNDSVFAIYAEETGFAGSLALIGGLIILTTIIFRQAISSATSEKKFLAAGVAGWLSAQSAIHIASNIGLIPTTGVPLPFFSYGPSSQLALMIALGIVANLQQS